MRSSVEPLEFALTQDDCPSEPSSSDHRCTPQRLDLKVLSYITFAWPCSMFTPPRSSPYAISPLDSMLFLTSSVWREYPPHTPQIALPTSRFSMKALPKLNVISIPWAGASEKSFFHRMLSLLPRCLYQSTSSRGLTSPSASLPAKPKKPSPQCVAEFSAITLSQ